MRKLDVTMIQTGEKSVTQAKLRLLQSPISHRRHGKNLRLWSSPVRQQLQSSSLSNAFTSPSGLLNFDQLSDEEKIICSETRLTPTAFLEYKTILITENAKAGSLRLSDARRLIKIDVNKTREIYDFLIKNCFVSSPVP